MYQKTVITRDFRLNAETGSLQTACTAALRLRLRVAGHLLGPTARRGLGVGVSPEAPKGAQGDCGRAAEPGAPERDEKTGPNTDFDTDYDPHRISW